MLRFLARTAVRGGVAGAVSVAGHEVWPGTTTVGGGGVLFASPAAIGGAHFLRDDGSPRLRKRPQKFHVTKAEGSQKEPSPGDCGSSDRLGCHQGSSSYF